MGSYSLFIPAFTLVINGVGYSALKMTRIYRQHINLQKKQKRQKRHNRELRRLVTQLVMEIKTSPEFEKVPPARVLKVMIEEERQRKSFYTLGKNFQPTPSARDLLAQISEKQKEANPEDRISLERVFDNLQENESDKSSDSESSHEKEEVSGTLPNLSDIYPELDVGPKVHFSEDEEEKEEPK
jgi:hypothetical protein